MVAAKLRNRDWDRARIQVWISREYYAKFDAEKSPHETMGSYIEFLYEFHKNWKNQIPVTERSENQDKMIKMLVDFYNDHKDPSMNKVAIHGVTDV